MGRSANDIIRSNHAPEYYWIYTDLLERELAYWLSPERVTENSGWLARVLTAIELMLLFEQRDSSHFIDQEKAPRRWREVFLAVWDGDWQDTDQVTPDYSDPKYREQHRPAIVAMFDRLESLARFWGDASKSYDETALTPLLPGYPLPYFSIQRWAKPDNQEGVSVERFTHDLIEQAAKDIIYGLSPEKRAEAVFMNVEEVWVAVDVLGFLCETYEQSLGVNEQVVRTWRETTIQIWKQFLAGDRIEWDETDSLYQNVMSAFERLEAVAQKYPPTRLSPFYSPSGMD